MGNLVFIWSEKGKKPITPLTGNLISPVNTDLRSTRITLLCDIKLYYVGLDPGGRSTRPPTH